jgi:ferrous iron transport protein B
MNEDLTSQLILIGQPNVGKSVLFHRLTGKYATVSNFPGTTVEAMCGQAVFSGKRWQIWDTPGVVSLPPRTEDERVARNAILDLQPRVLVQVADAKDLSRALHLTLELSEFGCPMVLVLNMADEMRDRGITVDRARLSQRLGIPVIETVAVTGEGIPELKRAIFCVAP